MPRSDACAPPDPAAGGSRGDGNGIGFTRRTLRTVPPTPAQVDRALLADLMLARGTLTRDAHVRSDADQLASLWADPSTRVLAVHEGRAAVTRDEQVRLALRPSAEADHAAERFFLGRDAAGTAYFAVRTASDGATEDLRELGALLDDRDAGILVTAVALDNWHRAHPHCSRCGAPTEVATGGWVRRCPVDSSEHYPRTDPAVIMLIRDESDRALLGRQSRWSPGWFSTLAGFVEPGETAEAAVVRETFEESGVRVGEVAYLGSQPWPFPSSLMLGYHGWATQTTLTPDGSEIDEVRWFSREEVADACRAGELRLPPPVSIAHRLIQRWFGEPLPSDWVRPLTIRR